MSQNHDRVRLAERMRLLERMQRRLAHDLRGPLNVLALNVDLLATALGPGGDPRPLKYLGALRRELAGLQGAFAGWLSLLAAWEGEASRVDVGAVVEETAPLLAGEARARGVDLDVSGGRGPALVEGRAEELSFVVVAVGWSALGELRRGDRLEIHASREGSEARVVWRATPSGSASDRREGGGIDQRLLGAARSIVEMHGGRLESVGSVEAFHMVLPLVSGGAADP